MKDFVSAKINHNELPHGEMAAPAFKKNRLEI